MQPSKNMNLEQWIFDFCIRFLAGICLLVMLTSCSAVVDIPATASPVQTATAKDQKATLQQEVPSPTPLICTVQTGVPSGSLNLRSGPGTQYAVVRVVNEDEVLKVIKFGTWLEVLDGHGNQGYVNSNYCK